MYLPRANNKYNTTLYQAAHIGDTTIFVNSVPSNLPTEVTLDYGLSTEETVTVVSSGSNSLTLQSGQSLSYAHSVGGSVQCLDQADFVNTIAGYFEQDHDQGGYHHIANFGLSDYVISGITIPTSAGLSATSTSGFAYITGKRIAVASDGGHTYTASQDTYVDVDNTGVYHYSGVSNGASAPALTANSIRIAKVITSGSAITNVVQFGADSNGMFIYPSTPLQNVSSTRQITAFGLSDYVVSGLTIPTSASLAATCAAGTAYINGFKIAISSDGGHTYTANQDTYVDVDWNGVYHYSGVSNGASAPALTAHSIRIAKVITGTSTVSAVAQFGADSNGVLLYPSSPLQNRENIRNISHFGLSDYVVSGLTIPTSGTLSSTSVAGIAYIGGYRISVASDGGHTYTASQDTYVDIDWNGVYHYSGVSNGSSAPSLTANSIRIAKVVTSGSAVIAVIQNNFDSLKNSLYPSGPVQVGATLMNPYLLAGWISANETWTYASFTASAGSAATGTFTTPGDVTNKYNIGDKLTFTNNSNTVYAYITGVSYSSSTGLSTITYVVDSGTTVANSAITANYYSKKASPNGFTHWFSYTPTFGASGSMTISSTSVTEARFCIIGRTLLLILNFAGTVGGTPSNVITVTMPVNSADTANTQSIGNGYIFQSNTNISQAVLNGSVSVAKLIFASDATNYATGSTNFSHNIKYRI